MLLTFSPHIFTSSPQARSWWIPFNFKPSWCTDCDSNLINLYSWKESHREFPTKTRWQRYVLKHIRILALKITLWFSSIIVKVFGNYFFKSRGEFYGHLWFTWRIKSGNKHVSEIKSSYYFNVIYFKQLITSKESVWKECCLSTLTLTSASDTTFSVHVSEYMNANDRTRSDVACMYV